LKVAYAERKKETIIIIIKAAKQRWEGPRPHAVVPQVTINQSITQSISQITICHTHTHTHTHTNTLRLVSVRVKPCVCQSEAIVMLSNDHVIR